MSRVCTPLHGTTGLLLLTVVVLALGAISCSRPATDQSADTGPDQLPFKDGDRSATAGTELASDSSTAMPHDSIDTQSSVPFHDSQSLPAGTLLTVRLKNAVSSNDAKSSGTFLALVEEPVVIDGETVVPRGAQVAGRIESARFSGAKKNPGYVRLALDQVDLDGQELPIRTSSLFARGRLAGTSGQVSGVVSLEQGRRLTFRLADTVYVASQSVLPHR